MATIYRDLRGDLYAVLSDGRNFYATYYGRTQPNSQVWEPDSEHEDMERVCECSDADAFILRETGDLGDIQQTRRSAAPRSYLAARALEMIEAWGLDPTHPISRFVRGSSERIPEGPNPDLTEAALSDLEERLANEEQRANEAERDFLDLEEEVDGLRAEIRDLKAERNGWAIKCAEIEADLRAALGLGR